MEVPKSQSHWSYLAVDRSVFPGVDRGSHGQRCWLSDLICKVRKFIPAFSFYIMDKKLYESF